MGLTLLLVISVAAIVSGILLTAQALNTSQVSVATNEDQAAVTAATSNDSTTPPAIVNFTGPPLGFGMGWGMMGEMRGRGPCGFGVGGDNVEISSDFIANVTAIAKADIDVQALLNSGYNITRVVPQIKMTIDGNGNVAMKATNATLLLTNGTTGRALVSVDLLNSKITQIVTLTKTVISK
jgi:hypothetical protein